MSYTHPTGMFAVTVCMEGDCGGGGGGGDGGSAGGPNGAPPSGPEPDLTNSQANAVAHGATVNVGGGYTYSSAGGFGGPSGSSGDIIQAAETPEEAEGLIAATKGTEALVEDGISNEKTNLEIELKAAEGAAKEGIYEFTGASGKTYVGQSGDIGARLDQHSFGQIVAWESRDSK